MCVHVLMGYTDTTHGCSFILRCSTCAKRLLKLIKKPEGFGQRCLTTFYLAVNAHLDYLWIVMWVNS